MATSYANSGGSGNRSGIVTVTDDGSFFAGGSGSNMIDGNLSANVAYYDQFSSVSRWLRFDFGVGASKVIDEAKHYQETTATHGSWQWQGSDNGSSWTDIGSAFTFGGATTQTITSLSGNTTGYRYYRLLGVSGSMNTGSWPYIYEFEFKLEDAGGGSAIPMKRRGMFFGA